MILRHLSFISACVFAALLPKGILAADVTASSAGWSIVADSNPGWTNGLYKWIDPYGTNHLAQNVWWWRSNAEGDYAHERSLCDLSVPKNCSATENSLYLEYRHPSGFQAGLTYTLAADGPSATVTETLHIIVNSSDYSHMSFFSYSDFDLAGTPLNDYAWGDPAGMGIRQDDADSNVTVLDTPLTNPVDFWVSDADDEANPYAIYVSLQDGTRTTFPNETAMNGIGDATYAHQWDLAFKLDAVDGNTRSISRTMRLTTAPEPISLILFPVGFGLLAAFKRKHKR